MQDEYPVAQSLMASESIMPIKRKTLTENLDQEISTLEDRLAGLKSLKAQLVEVPGVQKILDLLTEHGIR